MQASLISNTNIQCISEKKKKIYIFTSSIIWLVNIMKKQLAKREFQYILIVTAEFRMRC